MVKIAREQNKIAHELAKVSCRLGQSRVSFSSVLVCIQDDERACEELERLNLILAKCPVHYYRFLENITNYI